MTREDAPTLAELEADDHAPDPLAGTLPCPHGCGSRFHGESQAYRRHLADRAGGRCPDPWWPTRDPWRP